MPRFTPNLLNIVVPWLQGACLMMTLILWLVPGNISAQVTCAPGGCKGPNLVPYGNLEFDLVDPANPSLEFTTDFDYVVCPPVNAWDLWGRVTLQSNPNNCYSGWAGYDHTYGNGYGTMLLVDFPDSNETKTIWQVDVNVQPGQTYCFGAYYRNLNVGSNVSKPTFRYMVEDSLIGISPELPANGNWEYFGYNYTTLPGQTTLTISIENGKYGGIGNDLAVDDIEFRQVRLGGGTPVAHNDQFVVVGGSTPQYLDLLYNDTSSLGLPLAPQNVTITSEVPASVGTLAQDSTGLVMFTPAAGYLGGHTFSYEVCEPSGCCAQAIAELSIDNVLPASIEALEAKEVETGHLIEWEAIQDQELDMFVVEASREGRHFTAVGEVNSKWGKGAHAYRFMHRHPGEATFYRLRGVDRDGQVFYSPQVEIQRGLISTPQLIAYPNPVEDDLLYVEATQVGQGNAVLELMSRTGQIVWQGQSRQESGVLMRNIPVGRFPKGLYILRLKVDGHQSLQRIQIQ